MVVTIKRAEINKMDDISLIWYCIEPTIQQIRGKNFHIKSEAYSLLTTGQRSLLMFQMLYGHSFSGISVFFSHVDYLLSQKGVWEQLIKGMQYFGEDRMFQVLVKMKDLHNCLYEKESPKEESELSEEINVLDLEYQKILPATIKHIGAFIRNNPDEFIIVES